MVPCTLNRTGTLSPEGVEALARSGIAEGPRQTIPEVARVSGLPWL